MTAPHRHRTRELFAQAADLPAEERGAFLDDACRREPELRAELDALLAVDDDLATDNDSQNFLKSPPRPRARDRAVRSIDAGAA